MLPIEYCELPEELNRVDLYSEGKHWQFEKMPYIYHGLLYIPYREVCGAIGIPPYGGMPEYVTSGTLEREHMMTVVWEKETNTAYVIGILHYDGYRMISEHIYEKSRLSEGLVNRFFFIDAMVTEVNEEGIVVCRYEGDSRLALNNPFFSEIQEGDRKRFCFQYLGYSDDLAHGWLMEVAPIREYKRVGFMEYSEKDGKEIDRYQSTELREGMEQPENPFQRHLRLAEKYQDAELFYILGRDYQYGFDTEIDYMKAADCYEKAARTGHVNATLNLGVLHFCGFGLQQDKQKGIELYKRAAKGGDRIAMTNLGKLYRDGNGVEKSLERAEDYFMQAVCLGDGSAEYLMALMYKDGKLPDDYNHRNEIMWCRRSASHGFDIGQFALGELYQKGRYVPRSEERSLKLFLTAFSQQKTAAACSAVMISGIYSKNPNVDLVEMEYWMRCAAEIGSPVSQHALSSIYRDGPYKDAIKATYWAERAEQQGYPRPSSEETWVKWKILDKKNHISQLLAINGLCSLRVDEYSEKSSPVSQILLDSVLDTRTYNVLRRCNIYSLEDVSRLTEDELLHVRNLGRGAVNSIQQKLYERGLDQKKTVVEKIEINGIDILSTGFFSRPVFRRVAYKLRIRTIGELLNVPTRRIKSIIRHPELLSDLIEGLIGVGVPYERRKELNQLLIERLEQRKKQPDSVLLSYDESGRIQNLDRVEEQSNMEGSESNLFSERIKNLEEDMDELNKGIEELARRVDDLISILGSQIDSIKIDYMEGDKHKNA